MYVYAYKANKADSDSDFLKLNMGLDIVVIDLTNMFCLSHHQQKKIVIIPIMTALTSGGAARSINTVMSFVGQCFGNLTG